MPIRSLSRSFLLGVGATAVTTTVFASLATFFVYREDLTKRQLEHVKEYVQQREQIVSRRFLALADIHAKAAAQLTASMDALPPSRVPALLDHHLPLQADGTRRSRPEEFDGVVDADGDRVAGMGAFIAHGRDIEPVEGAALASAFHVVRHFGEGVASSYDNFYFATPHNRVIMYAPTRPDRLMFYRHDAPANLDFSGEEMLRMVAPAADPSGASRCTSLQRLIQDAQGKRLATACLTPFRYHGRYVGAFGSSLQLRDYLARAVNTEADHTASLLVRPQGDVIAVTGQSRASAPSPEQLARIEHDFDVRRLLAAVKRDGRSQGVLRSPDGRSIVGFARIEGPDWWLLLCSPEAELQAAAARPASLILGLGLLAALVQTALIVAFARRTLAKPLQRLAASCDTDAATDDLQRRDDEIGVLGRALAAERAKAQAAVASLEVRVAERTADLERASTEKDRFLANMSHELRTPLNGVIAVSETLAGLQRSARAKEMARLIVSSSRLLERVLSDVLDFSRLEAGEVRLATEPFDLAVALQHVAELHRVVAEAKKLTLVVNIAPELDGRWVGDAIRITQVVSNLLSNAVKFTGAGEVKLSAALGSRGGVVLTVSDTGIGFDTQAHARLFQRFEQADPSIRRRFGGTGLGLAICRSLVDAMGGEIRAVSSPGVGSAFAVELPLPRAAAAAQPGMASEPQEEAALAGVRVLLAEDHPTNQKVVELILESAGVELVIVENGREALDALSGGGFDLVLMDMQMPEMDGLSATRLWREREAMLHLRRTPIVMLTAHALDEHVEESLRAGADHHLSKPLRAADLLTVVEALTSPGAGLKAA